MSGATCGITSDFFRVLLRIGQRGVDVNGLTAALNFVETQTQPIRDGMKEEAVKIGFAFVWLLSFIIILILLIFLIWVSYELDISGFVVVSIVIIMIIVTFVLGALAVTRASNTIEDIIERSLGNLSDFANDQTIVVALNTLSSAAGVYLAALGLPCVAP